MSDIYRFENCAFSVATQVVKQDQKEFGNLVCRRYPPIPFQMEDGVHSHILPVNHNWWCGEWMPKPAPKALELPPNERESTEKQP